MSLIDSIGKVFQWRKELPYPIFYSFIPPRPQVFPREIAAKMDEKPNVWSSWISIENMSDRVLKDIRIKMPATLLYDPIVDANKWEFDRTTNEIKIASIDPQETAYMVVFPPQHHAREFIRPRVIIGDQLLHSSMQRYGYIKKYPWKTSALSLGVLLVLLAFSTLGINIYVRYQQAEDMKFIETTSKPWGCTVTILRGDDINERKIRGNRMNVDSILQINQAYSIDQLLQREQIIVCKQKP